MHRERSTRAVKTIEISDNCLAAVGLLNIFDFSELVFVYVC